MKKVALKIKNSKSSSVVASKMGHSFSKYSTQLAITLVIILSILGLVFVYQGKKRNGILIASDGIFTMSPSGTYPAFHHEGSHNRTYIGYYTSDAKVKLVYYDEDEKELGEPVTLWSDWAEGDDHAGPSVLVLQNQKGENSKHNGKILAASTAIFYDLPAQIRRSTYSENISEWEEPVTFDIHVEYPTLIELQDGTIYLFYAKYSFPSSGDRSQVYIISTDAGEIWSERHLLFEPSGERRIYGIYYSNPEKDEIHAMFNLCPENYMFGSWYKDIYYAQYDLETQKWSRADGTEYETPITPEIGDLVYETDMTEGEEDHTWLSDIKVDDYNSPYLLSINFKDYGSSGHNPGNNPGWKGIVQRHSFQDGEWKTEVISKNGAGQFGSYSYPAMAILDEDDVDTVYLTPCDNEYRTNLQKWQKIDTEWTKVEDITRGSSGYNFRPTFVRNGTDLKVLWCYTEKYEHHKGGQWESMIFAYPK